MPADSAPKPLYLDPSLRDAIKAALNDGIQFAKEALAQEALTSVQGVSVGPKTYLKSIAYD